MTTDHPCSRLVLHSPTGAPEMIHALANMLQNAVTNDLKDPDFWKEEMGIDLHAFEEAAKKHGTQVSFTIMFSKLRASDGDPLPPLRFGLVSGDPETVCGTVELEPQV